MPDLLSIADCLARLPAGFKMAERTLRRKVRATGRYMEHRGQLMLTEDDFSAFLEGLRPCSNSPGGARKGFGKSRAPSAASAIAKARVLIQNLTPKFSLPDDKTKHSTGPSGAPNGLRSSPKVSAFTSSREERPGSP